MKIHDLSPDIVLKLEVRLNKSINKIAHFMLFMFFALNSVLYGADPCVALSSEIISSGDEHNTVSELVPGNTCPNDGAEKTAHHLDCRCPCHSTTPTMTYKRHSFQRDFSYLDRSNPNDQYYFVYPEMDSPPPKFS